MPAHSVDDEQTRASFSWAAARAELEGLPGGGLNIAHEAVTRHARGPLADAVALRWLGKDGSTRALTYAQLDAQSNRFANLLAELRVAPGERVFSLLGRVPELYVALLGTLKYRAVFCPLFSAFGPEPIFVRMHKGAARVLVTTARMLERKVAELRERLPSLAHVLVIDEPEFATRLAAQPPTYTIPPTRPDDPALLHFTSGTTGQPKGALHVHEAVVAHHITGKLALDLHPGDVFWCTADPGWVTGTSYGVIAPLTNGATLLVDEGELEAPRWYGVLQDQHVDVWYTAPTAIRMLMRAGAELPKQYDLSKLRFIASVGEPLNPEAVRWGIEAYGQAIHDNWWQTETGGIMIANVASMPVKPGSMGKPLAGIEAAIVERDATGVVHVIDEPNREGELALRTPWPSMFRDYLDEHARYERCFAGEWYLSGDLARRDAEGYFWFVGRADDVIKSSGHLIGPFEVESALMEHPAVAEAGVIGKPDAIAGAIIKAFVVVKPGVVADLALQRDVIGFARKRLGPAVAPRELEFVADLPKTRSGKVMRRLLKARELGLPEGDLSTLETYG